MSDDIWESFKNFNIDSLKLDDDIKECDNEEDNEDTQSIMTDATDMIDKDELNEYDKTICDDCNTPTLIYRDAKFICTKCGLEQHKLLFEEAEYRCYADSNGKGGNPERVGMPTNTLLPESSLGTLIGSRRGDNINIKRMVQYNGWHQMPYKERTFYKKCCKIRSRCTAGKLSNSIIERAIDLYYIIHKVNISRGENLNGILAACVFISCKDQKVPRSVKEVAGIFGIKLHDMTKGIKNFKETWRLAYKNGDDIVMDTSNPIDFIDRYCSNLMMPCIVRYVAEFVVVKAIMLCLVEENTAPSIAAGTIFMVCNLTNQNISKKQVAEACKTSEVTISKCFKKLYERRLDLLPQEIITQYNVV